MEEDFYSPSLMASLLSSGTQGFPTAQPVQAAAMPAEISASSPPPGTTWGAYSDPNDPMSQYTVKFAGDKSMPLTVAKDTPVFLYDNKTKQVLASGIGPEGANAVAAAVYKMNTDPNSKNEWWDIYTGPAGATDPSQFTSVVTDPRNKNFGQRFLGAVGTLLPLAVSFIPGLGQASLLTKIGAGAATGAASSALKGQDILQGGLIGGATAGLVNAPVLSGGQSISDALSKAIGLGGNTANIGDLQARAIDTADFLSGLGINPGLANQIASGSLSNIGSIGGGAIGSAVGGSNAGNSLIEVIGRSGASRIPSSFLSGALNAASGMMSGVNYGDQVWGEQPSQGGEVNRSYVDPVTGDIVVPSGTTSFPMDPNSILARFLESQFPPLTSVDIPPLAGTELPEDGWTVEAPKSVVDASAAIIPPLTSVNIPPGAGTTLPSTGPSTLEQIMKYYSLGSGLLDMLGVGQGGAASGTASPYASTLGAVPNFGRGTFQPFTGDYEKYAFGPEWNFFGNNAQTPATTANTLAATTPANTLLPALTATTATPTARTATTGVTAGLLNAPMQATKQQAAQYISNVTAGNTAKAPEVTVPGLTGAQQLYLNSLSGTSSPTASNIDYVRSLSDYQALASLANTQGVFQPLNSPLSGYKTASDLSALYGVPVTSM